MKAGPICVFDPQDEDAAVMARKQVVEQRAAQPSYVEEAGRAGREANPDVLSHAER